MPDEVAPIDPASAVLLVMDVQQGIVANVPDSDALVGRIAEAVATARAAGMAVGYVRVAFEDADYAAVPPSNKSFHALTRAETKPFRDGTPDTQVDERVAPQPGDLHVRKVRVGAFSTTDLRHQLDARGITTLVLTGIATSGVVLSTVRDAADQDLRLVVLADACGDRDPQVHEVLTTKVLPRQADVVDVADLAALVSP